VAAGPAGPVRMTSNVNQHPCVVEVVERVPDAEVAIVAARVGERLSMPAERVRKLIEGRTGPITRALRADKADAIAQTFEAAGVRVVIRLADPEELEGVQFAEASAQAGPARAVESAPEAGPGPGPEGEPEQEREVEPEREVELEAEAEPGLESEPGTESGSEAEPRPEDAAEPEPTFEAEPGVEPAPEPEDAVEPGLEPKPTPQARSPFGSASDWGTDEGDDWGGSGRWATARTPADAAERRAPPALEPDDEAAWADEVELADDETGAGTVEVSETAIDGRLAGDVEMGPAPDPAGPAGPPVGRATRRPPPDAAEENGVGPGAPPAWRGLGPQPAPPWDRRQADPGAGPTHLPGDTPPFDVEPDLPPEATEAATPIARADAGEAARLLFEDRRLHRGAGPSDEDVTRQRRRGVLLVLLAIAVVGFVFSQWWVASRAGATTDVSAGFHAYRDGDFAAARRHWGRLAAAGDPTSQFMLGYLAEAGLGAPWSARAAAAWYRTAAEAGHAEAAWRLGRLYQAGLGVAPDDGEARRWFRAAADGGHGEAAFAWATSWMRELGIVWARDGVETWPIGVLDELSDAFERAAALGYHEAEPYAASLAAARAAGLGVR